MTEEEWLECDEPRPMLGWLAKREVARNDRWEGPPRDRPFRLFACACLRLAWRHLGKTGRAAVEFQEAWADGDGDEDRWYRESRRVRGWVRPGMEAVNLFWEGLNLPASVVGISAGTEGHGADEQTQLALVRCVFGNPFRRASLRRAWRTPEMVALAGAAYDERRLPCGLLDRARLLILADALLDAGCDDEAVLGHLRGAPHIRGCWVVDLLLGKR